MELNNVVKNWKSFEEAVKNLGGEVHSFVVEEPALEKEVLALENNLGFALPSSLKDVMLNFSGKVEFSWCLPDAHEFNDELSAIYSGNRHWSVEWIEKHNAAKDEWIEKIFSDESDPYDAVWHNKLAFHEVGNGDYLAIDLKAPDNQSIIYLSHNNGKGHGKEIAKDFKEFVILTSQLGCVGSEDWQWLPFLEEDRPYINPNSKNAVEFRNRLNVTLS